MCYRSIHLKQMSPNKFTKIKKEITQFLKILKVIFFGNITVFGHRYLVNHILFFYGSGIREWWNFLWLRKFKTCRLPPRIPPPTQKTMDCVIFWGNSWLPKTLFIGGFARCGSLWLTKTTPHIPVQYINSYCSKHVCCASLSWVPIWFFLLLSPVFLFDVWKFCYNASKLYCIHIFIHILIETLFHS